MRKIIMFNRMSLDAYYAGVNGEIDWFIHDPQLDAALHEMMTIDTILFGRTTYELFGSYWPDVAQNTNASEHERQLSNELNQMMKVVFSTSLEQAAWENSYLCTGNLIEEVRNIKQQAGQDIVIFGSGSIVQQLTSESLIDEYFIALTPIVLGTGKSLFHVEHSLELELVETKSYSSGNVLLRYSKGIKV